MKYEKSCGFVVYKEVQDQIEYKLPNKENVMKQSVYFLGKCITDDIACQKSEVSEAIFVPVTKAIELLTFDATKTILKEANAFIYSMKQDI